jgi:DNA-binding response OmpR family regulator
MAKSLRQTILVVENDEETRAQLAEALRQSGYSVNTAGDGITALSSLSQCPADLLLTDYRMPGIDGVELIRRVRLKNSHQAALLLSGCVDEELSNIGATQCLRKPISLDDLLWAVDCSLACHESHRPEATTTPVFQPRYSSPMQPVKAGG